ncbi:MAG: carotenoid biosynthesis protein [Anaerolineales bacterium]|jgi:putative membrane protein|nr:carotenoid biosynthesis protein [Anaerolineales bacterium]
MKTRTWSITLLCVYGALVAYTTVSALLGIRYSPIFTPMLSLLALSFALLHGSLRLGWPKILLLLALTFVVSLLFESVGVATGWVYGPYHYTAKLGPMFLGLVPYLVPVAWFMMTYPSYIIASRLAPAFKNIWAWRLWLAAVGALVMTSWDLAMDPVMSAGEHWIWEVEGAYFGIPLQNYWGWWLTVFVTFILFLIIGKVTAPQPRSYEFNRYDRLAILSYTFTTLSSIAIALRFGLGGPGMVGLFAMLPWILLSWQERI